MSLNINPYATTFHDTCAYIEYLAEHRICPNTVRNKLSHIRVHLSLLGLSMDSLNHPRVQRSLDAMDRDKTHVPRIKEPIPPEVFITLLTSLRDDPLMNIARAAYLLLYYGALRQSEVTSRTISSWDPTKHPTRGDIHINDQGCVLFVKFGKNLQKIGQYRQVHMAAASDPRLCPVYTLRRIIAHTPTINSQDPLFMFPSDRKPVPTTFLARVLRDSLVHIGQTSMTNTTSLHSLRKAAATDAFAAGCPELSIKQYGGWSSSAYTAYINSNNQQVNSTLVATLQNSSS